MMEVRNSIILRVITFLIAVCLLSLPAHGNEREPATTVDSQQTCGELVESSRRYIFLSDQSTVSQTGGIAGVHWTYSVEGQFQLTVDPNAGTAFFNYVDANATDESPFRHTLDPNEVFNMTDLVGTIISDTLIVFTGKAADDSDILIIAILNCDLVYLVGQTFPPVGSADFFIFNMDAVAQMKYGGGSGEPNDPYLIYTAEQMNAIGAEPNDWDKHFKLMADIDLAGFIYDGAPIAPDVDPCELGFQGTAFTGVCDGNGRTISHLTITGGSHLGLFGRVESGAEVKNLGLLDVNITGSDYVGGLVGFNRGSIATSYSTGTVSGDKRVGGLAGRNWGIITTSYSTAAVTGNEDVGGLAAGNYGSITMSYSTAAVTGNEDVGGLVGENYSSITMSYSTGTVSGETRVGGLVAYNWADASITSSFWDVETSGQSSSDGGMGLSTAEMQTASTFLDAGWDFIDETENGTEDIWWILEGQDYPRLSWELIEDDSTE